MLFPVSVVGLSIVQYSVRFFFLYSSVHFSALKMDVQVLISICFGMHGAALFANQLTSMTGLVQSD